MPIEPIIVLPQNYPPALSVLGVQVTVLASNAETRGYEVTLQAGDEGVGPPPHSHAWDEAFFVVAGSVEFTCADQSLRVPAGSFVHVPARTVHAFRFGPGGASMLELTGAGGAATRMFTQVAREVPPGPPDPARLVGILARHGVAIAA